ncbi:uncharacterized protein J3R85_012035 [Psidium guajava]|nr:uncharacterized protein J3R85_012035 [Psidium guajava]
MNPPLKLTIVSDVVDDVGVSRVTANRMGMTWWGLLPALLCLRRTRTRPLDPEETRRPVIHRRGHRRRGHPRLRHRHHWHLPLHHVAAPLDHREGAVVHHRERPVVRHGRRGRASGDRCREESPQQRYHLPSGWGLLRPLQHRDCCFAGGEF